MVVETCMEDGIVCLGELGVDVPGDELSSEDARGEYMLFVREGMLFSTI